MHSDSFDLSLYFRRIGYSGPAAADTATLHALMRHQLFSIPRASPKDVVVFKEITLGISFPCSISNNGKPLSDFSS